MSHTSSFQALLRRQRQERGLTQERLAELVGYSAETIAKIEGGRRRASPQLARRLAEVLQLAPEAHAAWMAAALAEIAPEPPDAPALAMPAIAAEVARRPAMPSPGLPAFLTPFVGREREQAELTALLARPDCRLLTLLGPGGAGKTRLAIETARSVSGFADGVAFVSLAPVAAPESIVLAIGEALGFAFVGAGDPIAQLLAHLRERRTLLILDNLEHLLDPAGRTLGLLGRLLAQAPAVTLLVTSRERLRLAGEWVLELGGLGLTPLRDASRALPGPALTLFAEHAERVDRAFVLNSANEAIVTTICRLVDGLPLGIELAAAWLRLLTLDEIAHDLIRDLDTAHLSPGALPPRHHSLRAVVDHSWQLLAEPERAALRWLSVFQGGFTREAAAEVAGANIALLATLADKSLLRRGASARYDLHEIIRQYADGRLRERPDELEAARSRHAAYYLRLAAEGGPRINSPQQLAATTELTAEIDNLHAAWRWAAACGQIAELDRAGAALQWFYEVRSWLHEGAALLAQAIEQLRAGRPAGAGDEWRRAFGRILGAYGYMATRSSAWGAARAALAESHALLNASDDPVGLARTLANQGILEHWMGDYAGARSALEQSIALTHQTGDGWTRALAQTWASIVAHSAGAYDEAEARFREALALWRGYGSPRAQIWCITYCSPTLLALGKYREAQPLLRESLALSQASDDRYGMAMSLHHLGRAALQQRDLPEAIACFREALPLLGSTSGWEYPQALNDLGEALWEAGSLAESRRAYQDALASAIKTQALLEALHALAGIAAHLVREGDNAMALELVAQVLADPAIREQTQRAAIEVQAAARAALTDAEAAHIEAQAAALPLAEIVAKLTR